MHRPAIRTSPCPKRLAELLAATAAKDEAAFAELYDSTKRKLFGIALMVLRRRDLAEDVTQEAFIRIWRSAASFDPARGMPITWMATIVRNLAIDVKRSPAAEPTDDAGLSVIPFNGRSALEELEASDDHRRLRDSDEDARSAAAQARDCRVHQRREPRAAEPALRRAGQHDQDLAAPRRARYPRRDRGERRAAIGWPGGRRGAICAAWPRSSRPA